MIFFAFGTVLKLKKMPLKLLQTQYFQRFLKAKCENIFLSFFCFWSSFETKKISAPKLFLAAKFPKF